MANLFTDDYLIYEQCVEAMVMCALEGRSLEDALGGECAAEVTNLVSARDFALKSDTAAKSWWRAEPYHPAIARALKVDRGQTGAVYAMAPFRLHHNGEKHVIIAAYPCPRILGPIDMDWLGIETVIAWNPVDDTASVMGDETPGLFGADLNEIDGPAIFASPRDFFTQWMMARAAFYVRLMKARGDHWSSFSDGDACPGKLAIGAIDKIQWAHLPREFEARGFDARELNRTILRQANLPRAFSNQSRAAS